MPDDCNQHLQPALDAACLFQTAHPQLILCISKSSCFQALYSKWHDAQQVNQPSSGKPHPDLLSFQSWRPQLELERKLRALLTKEKEKAEEEAALAMGLCTGSAMLP